MTVASESQSSGWILPHHWQRQRDLLRELVARDIKLRYRGSVIGILWTLLNPLAELLVLLFVFGVVLLLLGPMTVVWIYARPLARRLATALAKAGPSGGDA